MSSERSDETSQEYRDIRDLSHAFEMTQRRTLLIKLYTIFIMPKSSQHHLFPQFSSKIHFFLDELI